MRRIILNNIFIIIPPAIIPANGIIPYPSRHSIKKIQNKIFEYKLMRASKEDKYKLLSLFHLAKNPYFFKKVLSSISLLFVSWSKAFVQQGQFFLLASGENNLHESGGINQKKSKEKSHYQF